MTQKAWDAEWRSLYDKHWEVTHDPSKCFQHAHEAMLSQYGARPEGEPGPPFYLKFLAPLAGVDFKMIQKFWDFMNGKKTAVGALVSILAGVQALALALTPQVAVLIPNALPRYTAVVGGLTMVVGLLHKGFKFVYHEEHS